MRSAQMNGLARPDAQPWENYVFAIAAVAVVLLSREAMPTRDEAVTEVLYPGEEPSADDTYGAPGHPLIRAYTTRSIVEVERRILAESIVDLRERWPAGPPRTFFTPTASRWMEGSR
jgi:hypothetical protein